MPNCRPKGGSNSRDGVVTFFYSFKRGEGSFLVQTFIIVECNKIKFVVKFVQKWSFTSPPTIGHRRVVPLRLLSRISRMKIYQYICLHMKIKGETFLISTLFTFWDISTRDIWNVCYKDAETKEYVKK